MRRFLIGGRLDGDERGLTLLEHALSERQPHAVLFAGGICGGEVSGPVARLPHDHAHLYQRFFRVLGASQVYSALVPGAFDTPLASFLRLAINAEVDFPTVHSAHATLLTENDIALCGIGGELTHDQDSWSGHLRCSRAMAEYSLRSVATANVSRKILLHGSPPTGKLGAGTGSEVAGELIDTFHPDLCVVAGPTEGRGFESVGHTTVINPGRLADGCAAWLDWSKPADDRVVMLDLHQTEVANA